MTTNDGTVGRYLGWFLVALSLGAGVIHFAVSGGHFDVSWWHGAFFAVVAWLQVSWAAAVIVRPTRQLLLAGAVGNALVVVTWFVSRVWGVPLGPDSWTPEPVSLADGLATGFEVGIVVISLAVLLRPALAQQSLRPTLGLAGLAVSGVAVAAASTLALSPSFASEHHHGEAAMDGGEHAHGSGAQHSDGSGHAEGAAHAEGHTNAIIQADGTSACEQSGVANEGNSGHGHRGPVPFVPMDQATQEAYRVEVGKAYAAAARFPTVADAEAGGYRRITPYVPCIAAHYIKNSALLNPFDPNEPEILLYDGTEPGSRIVGLSFLALTEDPDVPPEGFPGDNDPWHVHRQLCIGGSSGGVVGDENTGEDECAERGGRVIPLENLYMAHMWPVAGWESRWSLFSSEHPDLGGTIGNINGDPRERRRQQEEEREQEAS